MNKILFTLLSISFFGLEVHSQESNQEKTSRFDDGTETLVNRKGGLGGFLEINTMPVYLNNQPGIMTGGGLSLVFGHSLNVGVAGYGLCTEIRTDNTDTLGDHLFLQTGYGGITLEPVLFSKKLVHVTFPVLLGAGGTSLTNHSLYDEETFDEDDWMNPEMYFIVRPGINMEINLLRILRLDLGVSYRFTSGYEMQNVPVSMLNGWSGNLSLKLGWF